MMLMTWRCKKCGRTLKDLFREALLWELVSAVGGSISGSPPTECPKGGEHELEMVEEVGKEHLITENIK